MRFGHIILSLLFFFHFNNFIMIQGSEDPIADICRSLDDALNKTLSDYQNTGYTKTLTFPVVSTNATNQMIFTRQLELLPAKNQCAFCCCAAALIRFFEYLPVLKGTTLSVNFLVASHLRVAAFSRITNPDNLFAQCDNIHEMLSIIQQVALATESSFPSDTHVDIPALSAALEQYSERASVILTSGREQDRSSLIQKINKQIDTIISRYIPHFKDRHAKVKGVSSIATKFKFLILQKDSLGSIWTSAFEEIKSNIDEGKPLLLGYYHSAKHFDPQTGILDIANNIIDTTYLSGNHAIVVVGYKLDSKSGQISYLKLQNSHGEPSTIIMRRSYFLLYGMSLYSIP